MIRFFFQEFDRLIPQPYLFVQLCMNLSVSLAGHADWKQGKHLFIKGGEGGSINQIVYSIGVFSIIIVYILPFLIYRVLIYQCYK